MRRLLPFLALLALAAAVAAGSSFLAGRYLHPAACEASPGLHALIHKQLHLTEAQEAKLEPVEARFAEKRRLYAEAIRRANLELADAIAADKADSPRVQAAVEHIHAAMGGLQKATLDHVFEMRDALTPEQYETLLRLTTDGLRAQP